MRTLSCRQTLNPVPSDEVNEAQGSRSSLAWWSGSISRVSIRTIAEKVSRNRVIKKRLPSGFRRAAIYVSPDASLRYWQPGSGAFDRMLLEAASERVTPEMTVWDVGANVGVFALAAASTPGRSGDTLAIEPDPFLAGLIQRSTVQKPQDAAGVTVICAALADRSGLAEFSIATRGRASNSLLEAGGRSQAGGTRHRSVVPVLHPDALVELAGPPGFIKIDVEGAELCILRAAESLLARHHPELLVEVGEADRDEVTRLLHDLGYTLHDAAKGFAQPVAVERCCFNTFATAASSR